MCPPASFVSNLRCALKPLFDFLILAAPQRLCRFSGDLSARTTPVALNYRVGTPNGSFLFSF